MNLISKPTENHRPATTDPVESKFAELRALIGASNNSPEIAKMSEIEVQYRSCLMENVSEGVVFVNHEKRITCWNRSAELITGLAASNMLGSEFTPNMVGITKTEEGERDVACPVSCCMESQKQSVVECSLFGRSGREVKIELTVVPVVYAKQCHGCVVLINDLSANVDLKRQLSDLQNASILDPLTHVANRAEFERNLREYVSAHRATTSKCCLIVCDIDFFKMVNDTYGHHVGDQALTAFAQTLKQFVRSRDIVARYGGEEFVILCANCDLDNAVERAEQIRLSLNKTPQQMLNGKTLSASFGVSELRDDEDVTEFFVRADKALFRAKQSGRNQVAKANESVDDDEIDVPNYEKSPATGIQWKNLSSGSLFSEEYRTSTPSSLLVNKLRGYVIETNAKIRCDESDYLSLTVLAIDPQNSSKKTHFRIDVEIFESVNKVGNLLETFIRITIFPPKLRLFRRVHKELHSLIVNDIRRYLMISEETACVELNLAATSSGRD